MKVHLPKSVVETVNRTGTGYVGVLVARGPRGARFRPLVTEVWRSPELAQKRLDDMRFRQALVIQRREVVEVRRGQREV